ncbi:hypothetical protein G5C60_11000 [Streptomyces sp. HC44]|uniref:Uncharacterized protein n=1 Tax=Streptomyces scabichelini TaxID=2711217 RepID=A0A6G4V2N9_9ACTN|nr:hypothetical protein [Streptomyces scabichelini]
MTAEPEHPVVHGELAELRRSHEVGLARIEGGLALLTQHDERTAKDLDDLSARVVILEHNRWPLPALVTVTAVGSLVVTVWQAFGR